MSLLSPGNRRALRVIFFVSACNSPQSPLYGGEGTAFHSPGGWGAFECFLIYGSHIVGPCPCVPHRGGGEEPLRSPGEHLDRAIWCLSCYGFLSFDQPGYKKPGWIFWACLYYMGLF